MTAEKMLESAILRAMVLNSPLHKPYVRETLAELKARMEKK